MGFVGVTRGDAGLGLVFAFRVVGKRSLVQKWVCGENKYCLRVGTKVGWMDIQKVLVMLTTRSRSKTKVGYSTDRCVVSFNSE